MTLFFFFPPNRACCMGFSRLLRLLAEPWERLASAFTDDVVETNGFTTFSKTKLLWLQWRGRSPRPPAVTVTCFRQNTQDCIHSNFFDSKDSKPRFRYETNDKSTILAFKRSWLLMAALECSWLLLAALGCSWLLLGLLFWAALGCFGLLLAAPDCSRLLPAALGCLCLLLAAHCCFQLPSRPEPPIAGESFSRASSQ